MLTYNLASAIKGLCFAPEERTARFKKYRLLLVHLAGRMSRFRCKLRLRFCVRLVTHRKSRQRHRSDSYVRIWDIRGVRHRSWG